MRVWTAALLACPGCGGALGVEAAQVVEAGEVQEGLLACVGCGRRWPVRERVARLCTGSEHKRTQRNFSAQWRLRLGGAFEERGVLFGNHVERLTAWLVEEPLGGLVAGQVVVDAGCGSGEKLAALASRYPEVRFLGVDLAETLGESARRTRGLANLDFVQGDLLCSPLRPRSVDRLISWGVLHHTPDTRRAFLGAVEALAPGGRVVIWLYPHPEEDPAWAFYYQIRDVHFLGRGHLLPEELRLALCRVYCAVMAPALLAHYFVRVAPKTRELPWVEVQPTELRRSWQSAVFILHDALAPEFQFRHRRGEVGGWFYEAGLSEMRSDGHGHFWAERP